MPDGRCFRLTAVRLRPATATGHATGDGGRTRSHRLYAPGRTRHWPRAEDQSLQAAGTGLRHGRGESETRVWNGSSRVWPGRANPDGSWTEDDQAADQ